MTTNKKDFNFKEWQRDTEELAEHMTTHQQRHEPGCKRIDTGAMADFLRINQEFIKEYYKKHYSK